MNNSLFKLEKDYKKLKKKLKLKRIKITRRSVWSFEIPVRYYTPYPRNCYEGYRSLEETRKPIIKLYLKKRKKKKISRNYRSY